MTRPITLRVLFDVTRLQARAGFATPTGIDRVDLAYLEALHAQPRVELHLVRIDAFGPHLLAAKETTRVLESLSRRPPASASASTSFDVLWRWLQAPAGSPPPVPVPAIASRAAAKPGARRWLDRPMADLRLRRLVEHHGRPRCLYLNTSHGQSYRAVLARWLHRTRIPAVFFIHDLLPIDFPEFNRAAEPRRHVARIRTASECAGHVLVNSEVTGRVLHDYLTAAGWRVPPITVLPLGVGEEFRRHASAVIDPPAVPYFVVLGTIEPRKNHALLLRVWRRLAASSDAPRLVILGRRGWNNEAVFRVLDGDRTLRGHVVEWQGIDDAGVRTLLQGARALLAPSFAEGYHLPVVEALSLGTPVLASDIAAHREVAGPYAELLGPEDDEAWSTAIREYAAGGSARRAARHQRSHGFEPVRWPAHLAAALAVLEQAAREI